MPTCWIIAGPNGAGKTTFTIETTLAGRSYLKLIKRLQLANWEIKLFYLAIPNVEMSKKRVAERVLHGGHNIPNKDIEWRYPRILNNLLNKFSHKVGSCICFMNLGNKLKCLIRACQI